MLVLHRPAPNKPYLADMLPAGAFEMGKTSLNPFLVRVKLEGRNNFENSWGAYQWRQTLHYLFIL